MNINTHMVVAKVSTIREKKNGGQLSH